MKKATLNTPEEYIERNIKIFTEQAFRDKEFGTSYVQRVCRIGYDQAQYAIEAMLDRKIIDHAEHCAWKYIFNT